VELKIVLFFEWEHNQLDRINKNMKNNFLKKLRRSICVIIIILSSVYFSMGQTITDIDGNTYNSVTIGSQIWMVENLKTTKYRNGDAIPNITVNTAWVNLTTGAYCDYNNNPSYSATYGRLYNWHAINDSRKIAPPGWHVATDTDLSALTAYLGGISIAGGKLKETGTVHWGNPNTGATNEAGFTALPGGYRSNNGTFLGINAIGSWWSSSESSASDAWALGIFADAVGVDRGGYYTKNIGFSIRCIKDASATNINNSKDIPSQFSLLQNYPNPFNPSTNISYLISEPSMVSIIIYNVYGQRIETLVNENLSAGKHSTPWRPKNLASGVYYYRLHTGKFNEIKKMIYIR